MAIDPWAGYNSGMQNLGSTFEDIRKENKEAPLKALQLRMLEQKASEDDIRLQQMQQQINDQQGARTAGANAGAPASLSIVNPDVNTTLPQAGSDLQNKLAAMQAGGARAKLTSMPSSDYVGLKTNVDQNPQMAQLSGAADRLRTMGTEAPQEQPINQALIGGTNLKTDQIPQSATITETKAAPATPAQRTKAQIDYLESIGNTAEANKLKQGVAEQAKSILDITGDAGAAIKHVNEATGSNFTLTKLHKLNILKDGDGNATQVIDESGVAADQAAGMPLSEAMQKNSVSLQGPEGSPGRQLSKFVESKGGKPTYAETTMFLGRNNISSTAKGVALIVESIRKHEEDETRERRDNRREDRMAAQFAATQNRLSNNGERPKPLKPLPAGQLGDLADAKKMIDNLKDAQRLAPSVITGPISGRAQSAAAMVGKAPKAFVEYRQKLATVNNIMLKLRSGAAVTEQEYSRFLQEMPTANDAPETSSVKLKAAINYATELMDEKALNYEEGGYKVPEHIKASNRNQSNANSGTAETIPTTVMPKINKAVGTMKEGQHFSFTINGRTVTGTRKGGKPVFD